MAARTSLTPAATAETSTKWRLVWPETIEAIVVLPVPGRSPQQQRHRLVALDQPPQRRPGREQVLLADELVEVARAHPHRQRRGVVGVAGERAARRALRGQRSGPSYAKRPSIASTLSGRSVGDDAQETPASR